MPTFGIWPLAVRLAVAGACAALAACQGMYIHNADRAAIATTAKKSIDTVDVAAISKTDQENLAKLLEEEIKAVEARSQLVATLAVLDLAASDQSIARHYQDALQKMKLALDTTSMMDLQSQSDCQISKKYEIERNQRVHRINLVGFGVQNPPACAPNMQALTPPNDLPADLQKEFAAAYRTYATSCETIENMCKSRNHLASEDFGKDRQAAAARQKELSDARRKVKEAREAYDAALQGNKDRTKAATETEQDIRKKAKDIVDAVNQLSKLSLSAANQEKGRALVDLLTAAAGGKADSTDPDLAPALEIAKLVPSLAQSIETARAQRAQVPVSHLLLALNNLTIQAERDERLRALDTEELSVDNRKADALVAQADLWRQYNHGLCSLILLKVRNEYPGPCDTIVISEVVKGELRTVKCSITYVPVKDNEPAKAGSASMDPASMKTENIDECVLAKSWKALFAEELDSAQTRQLNEAAAAYLHVRLIAYNHTIEEFRRIAIDHRRAVVRSEAALQQWKNLVSVPAGELAGYYGGGIKPEALADLIVKALGFTAIAIGVAQ